MKVYELIQQLAEYEADDDVNVDELVRIECEDCEEYQDYHCDKFCTVIRHTIHDLRLSELEENDVEAIPIEWLLLKYPISGMAGTEAYFRKAHIVRDLIAEWRKAQETRCQ